MRIHLRMIGQRLSRNVGRKDQSRKKCTSYFTGRKKCAHASKLGQESGCLQIKKVFKLIWVINTIALHKKIVKILCMCLPVQVSQLYYINLKFVVHVFTQLYHTNLKFAKLSLPTGSFLGAIYNQQKTRSSLNL